LLSKNNVHQNRELKKKCIRVVGTVLYCLCMSKIPNYDIDLIVCRCRSILSDPKSLNEENRKFLVVELPAFVQSLHIKVQWDRATKHNELLIASIDLLSEWLQAKVPFMMEPLGSLQLLFDENSQFYKEYPAQKKPNPKPQPGAQRPEGLLRDNASHFVQNLSGLNLIAAQIEGGCPIQLVPGFLTVAVRVRRAAEFSLGRIPKAACGRFLSCPDSELKDLSRAQHDRLLVLLDDLAEKSEDSEKFRLDFALKLLRCNNLDKRTIGIGILSDMVKDIALPLQQRKIVRWMTQQYLSHWVIEKQILALALNENSHSEILRRAGDLLLFCAQCKVLNEAHFKLIWAWCRGSDQHSAKIMYSLLVKITRSLEQHALDYITARMLEVPHSEDTMDFLSFVKDFTQAAPRSDPRQIYGLPFLWKAITAPRTGSGNELSEHAQKLLASLLEQKGWDDQKIPGLNLCAPLLAKKEGEPVLLIKLMQSILQSTDTTRRSSWIERLQADSKLLDVLLDDIRSFYYETDRDPELARVRFRFLDFLLRQSKLVLTKLQAVDLWNKCVFGDAPAANIEVAEAWFVESVRLQATKEARVFEDDVCEALWNNLVQGSFFVRTQDAFSTMMRLFLAVNTLQSNLVALDTLPKIVVVRRPLEGEDSFWGVLSDTDNENVAERAAQLLVALSSQLGGGLDKAVVRRVFIEKALSLITQASSEECKSHNKVARYCQLLRSLGHRDQPEYKLTKPEVELTVNLTVKPKMTRFDCVIASSKTVGDLKASLSEPLQISPQRLQLSSDGAVVVKDDAQLLDAFPVTSQRQLNFFVAKLDKALPPPQIDRLFFQDQEFEQVQMLGVDPSTHMFFLSSNELYRYFA